VTDGGAAMHPKPLVGAGDGGSGSDAAATDAAGADAGDAAAASQDAAVDAAALDAAAPGTDAASPGSDAGGGNDAGGACSSGSTCDDFSLATSGLHAGNIWITRLRASLPAAALGNGDLHLEAAPSQTPVTGRYTADHFTDPHFDPCRDSLPAATPGDAAAAIRGRLGRHAGDGVTLLFTVLGIVLLAKTRRR
jgi:hypothetical protein